MSWSVSARADQNPEVFQQGLWNWMDQAAMRAVDAEPWVQPAVHRAVRLNEDFLLDLLADAPMEFTPLADEAPVVLALPMPDGRFERFAVVESPVMEAPLAAKFPEIKTYRGQGIDNPTSVGRFDHTPAGFHGQVLSPDGTYYIDPLFRGDTEHYATYYKRDQQRDQPFSCLTQAEERMDAEVIEQSLSIATGEVLRTYRIAVAATGEYTSFHGGTVAAGLAAVTTAVNRITGVYENEVSVRLVLVANNNLIIYTNPATDPYSNHDVVAMLSQNQSNLNSVIGTANYDIGHVFGTAGGGVASLGVVCNNFSKARGVTGLPSPTGDVFWIDYAAHEMGHQFRANHTFNSSTGSCCCGNRNGSTAYEPGSASTIMGYAGICSSDNLQSVSDHYFHAVSQAEMINFTQVLGGNACAVQTATGNTAPTVEGGPNHTIPQNTPFRLTAVGSDPDDDTLTYCWEQYDLGPSTSLSNPDNGSSPLFRSRNPSTSPTRWFPQLSNIISGVANNQERLPTTNRNLNFRVTVRDNRSGGGGTSFDTKTLAVTTSAGPFAITSPMSSVTWSGAQTVTWNVANTNVAPVNATHVNILLSTNSGLTFPHVLAENTPNDGSELVFLPPIATTSARIMVEAVDNVFLAMSRPNFTIDPCPGVEPPLAEPVSPTDKNRYISFQPGAVANDAALRVILADLPAPFSSFNGDVRWVGPASLVDDSPSDPIYVAELQCEPYFGNWSGIDLLHVYGREIVPGASYEIQGAYCDPGIESNFSTPLTVVTAKWGDVVSPFSPPEPPATQPDITDISALVAKFGGSPGAPIKSRAQLQPEVPDPTQLVSIQDISSCVAAFGGESYPYGGPVSCP